MLEGVMTKNVKRKENSRGEWVGMGGGEAEHGHIKKASSEGDNQN